MWLIVVCCLPCNFAILLIIVNNGINQITCVDQKLPGVVRALTTLYVARWFVAAVAAVTAVAAVAAVTAVALLSFHCRRDICNQQQISTTLWEVDADNRESARQTAATVFSLCLVGGALICSVCDWIREPRARPVAILFNALAMHGAHCKKWRHIASNSSIRISHFHQQSVLD